MLSIERQTIFVDSSYTAIIPIEDPEFIESRFMMDPLTPEQRNYAHFALHQQLAGSFEQNMQRFLIPGVLKHPWFIPRATRDSVTQMGADLFTLNNRSVVNQNSFNGITNRFDLIYSRQAEQYVKRNFGGFVENIDLSEALINLNKKGFEIIVLTNIALRGREGLKKAVPRLFPYLRKDRSAIMRPNDLVKSPLLKIAAIGFSILEELSKIKTGQSITEEDFLAYQQERIYVVDDDPVVISELFRAGLCSSFYIPRTKEQLSRQPQNQQEALSWLFQQTGIKLIIRNEELSITEETHKLVEA